MGERRPLEGKNERNFQHGISISPSIRGYHLFCLEFLIVDDSLIGFSHVLKEGLLFLLAVFRLTTGPSFLPSSLWPRITANTIWGGKSHSQKNWKMWVNIEVPEWVERVSGGRVKLLFRYEGTVEENDILGEL